MRFSSLVSWLSLILWGGFFAFSSPVVAQTEWWTLTDMTPQELRAFHEDKAAAEARYRRLVMEGHLEAPDDDSAYGKMRMVYIGRDTPELVPLWHAFDGFAGLFRMNPASLSRAKPNLVAAGMSEPGADAVIQYAVYLTDWTQREIDASLPRLQKWMAALRKAKKQLGETRYREAVEHRRAELLGGFVGLSEEESRELMKAWLGDPVRDMKLARLEDLRLQVSDQDWDAFRRFLLENVAPHQLWVQPEEI